MRLHGRVRRDGDPVEGAYVQLVGPSGDFTAEVRTDITGRFVFYPIPGQWVLRGYLPGGHRVEARVLLSEGQTLDVDLDDGNGRARP